jgi:hypothetical protein
MNLRCCVGTGARPCGDPKQRPGTVIRAMHEKLRWQRFGIKENLKALEECLTAQRAQLPVSSRHTREKFERWLDQIGIIQDRIHAVETVVLPRIEADLGYALDDGEMLVLALFQPGTRNLFTEIGAHFRERGCAIPGVSLSRMAGLSDAAETLAWIGDSALKIGVLPAIWTEEIAEAGALTQRRQAYERNANLARLCDNWGLFSHRIDLDPHASRADAEHLKGTLVEAVIGIIFLKGGLRAVADAAVLLAPEGSGRG